MPPHITRVPLADLSPKHTSTSSPHNPTRLQRLERWVDGLDRRLYARWARFTQGSPATRERRQERRRIAQERQRIAREKATRKKQKKIIDDWYENNSGPIPDTAFGDEERLAPAYEYSPSPTNIQAPPRNIYTRLLKPITNTFKRLKNIKNRNKVHNITKKVSPAIPATPSPPPKYIRGRSPRPPPLYENMNDGTNTRNRRRPSRRPTRRRETSRR